MVFLKHKTENKKIIDTDKKNEFSSIKNIHTVYECQTFFFFVDITYWCSGA